MKRIKELDGLRGLAALTVVLFHAYPNQFFLGWSAVDLFFVLSGYLITSIIIKNVSNQGFLTSFYSRRILRIWPVYFLTLAVVLILNAFSRTGYSTDGLFQHLTFTQNIQGYWLSNPPGFVHAFSPSWSIAVEEQFYLVWPLLLLYLGTRYIPVLAGLTIVAAIAGRMFGFPNSILLSRGDGLALGCLLASIFLNPAYTEKAKKLFLPLGVASCGYILFLVYRYWGDPEPKAFIPFTLFFFSLVGLIVCYSGHPLLKVLRLKPLAYLGLISYSMYLFHLPIFTYAPPLLARVGLPSTLFTWALIFGLPMLSYHLLESPILNFKERISYRKQKPQPAEFTAPQELAYLEKEPV